MKTPLKTLVIALMAISLSCNAKPDKIASQTPVVKNDPSKPNKQYIKVALLLDTSNSMDGLIDQAKAQLWEIVNELSYAQCNNKRPDLLIALYEYGNDNLNADEGYIRQVLQFSNDLDEISKQLFSLTTRGGNEFCGQVIQTTLDQLNWGNNPDDLKLIFIAGNEPFTQGKMSYKHAATNANENGVTINTIFCGDYQQGISTYWKDGADLTRGNYMAINHNQTTVYVPSPYDDQILLLNKKLNETYIIYGTQGRKKIMQQEQQDNNAEGYSKANAVNRTISKSSHLYMNSTWDLVDADKEDDFNYENLKESELPEVLKGKTTAEIKAYVAQKKKERKAVKQEIQELNSKRKVYLSKQNKNNNTLENAMIQAIKQQAKNKNYTWK